MVTISQVGEGVYLMEVPQPKITSVFTVYLIREDGGALVEPGPASNAEGILQGLQRIGYDTRHLSYIIPTHIHLDHGGGTGYLAQKFPQAKAVIHPEGKRHMVDPTRLINSTKMAFGDDFEDRYGPIIAIPESQIVAPQDGDIIRLGSRELQIFYAPGHAPHHIAILDLKTGGLFCGEACGVPVPGTEMPIPHAAAPGFDMEVYIATMEKMKALKPKMLFYSHGKVGPDPQKLINLAQQNTRAIGDLVLASLKAGEAEAQISQKVGDYMKKISGGTDERSLTNITATGYLFYFKRKGLA